MNLHQIIERAASIIGLEVDFNYDSPSLTLKRLVDSARMIYTELSLEYLSLKHTESVTLSGNKMFYSELSYPVREVLAVKRGSTNLDFKSRPTYIELKGEIGGEIEVTYLYYHPEPQPQDELSLPPQYTVHFLANGVVSEYYYRVGMVDEALFYKTRYEHSLANLTRKTKTGFLPARRFIW